MLKEVGYLLLVIVICFSVTPGYGQDIPTGNAEDFELKTCLHSVSYAGIWRGHSR